MLRKPTYEEGYIIYNKEEDCAIYVIDALDDRVNWTDVPTLYKVYDTESDAKAFLKFARESADRWLKHMRHIYSEQEEAINIAKHIIKRAADAKVLKVKKSVIIDIEGV